MIACYAMGGGLGHLTRARRVLQALGCPSANAAILSASPLARGPDIVPVPRRLANSRVDFAAWLKKTLQALAPSAVGVKPEQLAQTKTDLARASDELKQVRTVLGVPIGDGGPTPEQLAAASSIPLPTRARETSGS